MCEYCNYCLYCKEIIESNESYVKDNGNFYHLECYRLLNDLPAENIYEDIDYREEWGDS